jgi:uncharacterized membrane protein YdjX (TVP38/TMEM64 family)
VAHLLAVLGSFERVRLIGSSIVALLLLLAVWVLLPAHVDPQAFIDGLAPHRHAWYALPAVVVAYVGLGLVLVPVILLIAATGIAFGPLLGPVYAMTGCLASAWAGFAIGRWAGPDRIERLGGRRVVRVTRVLERNGTLAVFLMRKVPAPFMLANIVAGAARIRFQDFMIGTVLGMGAFVVAVAGFGYQLPKLFDNPSPGTLAGAALFVCVPLTIAWFINRSLRRARDVHE